jgi:ABC-type Na+ transport system ATPase subunit NatA
MIVLHQGRVLAAGSVPEVVRRAGAAHVREAFTSLIAKASA